jgi:amino acid permease
MRVQTTKGAGNFSPESSSCTTITVIVGLNCFPVKYHGETKFWFARIKIRMVLGFLFLSLTCMIRGRRV